MTEVPQKAMRVVRIGNALSGGFALLGIILFAVWGYYAWMVVCESFAVMLFAQMGQFKIRLRLVGKTYLGLGLNHHELGLITGGSLIMVLVFSLGATILHP